MKKLFKLPFLAALLAAFLICASAFASQTKSLPVRLVEFSQQPGYNQLLIQVKDGTTITNYYANPGAGAPGCQIPEATLETTKMWLGMAQASVLSGRSVMIYYTPCNGWNWITAIDLGP